jgi:hypothetical protein
MKRVYRSHDAQRSFTLSRRACASWLVGVAATLAIACASCTSYTVLTPADLQQRGTRSFPGATRQAAVEASATALESIGYRVTQRSADTGIVKTAPREIFAEATTQTDLERSAILDRVEGAKSTTTVQRDALAWTLRITPSGDGVTIVATPRAYRNGDEIDDPNAFVAEVMDPKFAALWREVGDSMGAATKAGP